MCAYKRNAPNNTVYEEAVKMFLLWAGFMHCNVLENVVFAVCMQVLCAATVTALYFVLSL